MAVDSVRVLAVQKFNYLLSCLERRGYKAIARIAVSNANYKNAIQVLKRRFGDKNIIKTALYQELRNIQRAGSELRNLCNTIELIDKVCSQLGALRKNVNHANPMLLIQEKLPRGILIKLEEYKQASKN